MKTIARAQKQAIEAATIVRAVELGIPRDTAARITTEEINSLVREFQRDLRRGVPIDRFVMTTQLANRKVPFPIASNLVEVLLKRPM